MLTLEELESYIAQVDEAFDKSTLKSKMVTSNKNAWLKSFREEIQHVVEAKNKSLTL